MAQHTRTHTWIEGRVTEVRIVSLQQQQKKKVTVRQKYAIVMRLSKYMRLSCDRQNFHVYYRLIMNICSG